MNKYRIQVYDIMGTLKSSEYKEPQDILDQIKEYIEFEWAEPFGHSIGKVEVERIYIEK